MSVKSIVLGERALLPLAPIPIVMTSIDTVMLSYQGAQEDSGFVTLLAMCPNITSLDRQDCNISVWSILAASSLQLRTLTSPHFLRSPHVEVNNALKVLSPYLRVLKVSNALLTAIFDGLSACTMLQVLSVNANEPIAADTMATDHTVVQLLHKCKHLKELYLCGFNHSVDVIDAILTAGRDQLQYLEIAFNYNKMESSWMVTILESHPWLEHLVLQPNQYSRSHGHLKLSSHFSFEQLLRICDVCSKVTTLSLPPKPDEQCAALFGDKLGSHLLELSARSDCSCGALRAIIVCTPQLIRLNMTGGLFTDDHLKLVAKYCPNLTLLRLHSNNPCSMTDLGLIAVLEACCKLEELTIDGVVSLITIRCLQIILTNKLPLRQLSFHLIPFSMQEVDQFRLLASEEQMLPVLMINGAYSWVEKSAYFQKRKQD